MSQRILSPWPQIGFDVYQGFEAVSLYRNSPAATTNTRFIIEHGGTNELPLDAGPLIID